MPFYSARGDTQFFRDIRNLHIIVIVHIDDKPLAVGKVSYLPAQGFDIFGIFDSRLVVVGYHHVVYALHASARNKPVDIPCAHILCDSVNIPVKISDIIGFQKGTVHLAYYVGGKLLRLVDVTHLVHRVAEYPVLVLVNVFVRCFFVHFECPPESVLEYIVGEKTKMLGKKGEKSYFFQL